ncbi:hypothetical protein IV203_017822 [Nitzschia inconspicua]|uniref:Uncharacterized protein n=1 Tax=Nitzschia inconspicua TaxID=303405 RepID=A0A9K3Q5U1_9STRA|nr:hypothetical protein IV203_020523 [Nitzschia inconspicua]KAG7371681.1 hypothetical protein IV203_017822 [Nitzschia inconspicua]
MFRRRRLPSSPSTIITTTKTTTSSLYYRDGPDVDLYEHVTAEVLRPDVTVPPAAKRAFIVTDEDEERDAQKKQQQQRHHQASSSTFEPPSVWETSKVQTIEGGCLKTFTMDSPEVEHVQLLLKNDGTPLNAKADVFCGPGNAPMQLAVYSDDGARFPFSGVICTPYMVSHSIGVKNSGPIDENPMNAVVLADMEHIYGNRKDSHLYDQGNLAQLTHRLLEFGTLRRIHGGDDQVFAFHKPVESVQILLKTDGRPCQARIELCSDGDTIAQVVEVYSEDGHARPFFAVLDTPGLSNMVRVVNVGDPSFPISACVEPFMVDADYQPPSSAQQQDHPRVVHNIGLEDMPPPPPNHHHTMGQQPRPPPPRPNPIPVDPFIVGGNIGFPGIEDDVGFFFVD